MFGVKSCSNQRINTLRAAAEGALSSAEGRHSETAEMKFGLGEPPQARTCWQLKRLLRAGGSKEMMQKLYAEYLLRRLERKKGAARAGGGRRGGRGRSHMGGRQSSMRCADESSALPKHTPDCQDMVWELILRELSRTSTVLRSKTRNLSSASKRLSGSMGFLLST